MLRFNRMPHVPPPPVLALAFDDEEVRNLIVANIVGDLDGAAPGGPFPAFPTPRCTSAVWSVTEMEILWDVLMAIVSWRRDAHGFSHSLRLVGLRVVKVPRSYWADIRPETVRREMFGVRPGTKVDIFHCRFEAERLQGATDLEWEQT